MGGSWGKKGKGGGGEMKGVERRWKRRKCRLGVLLKESVRRERGKAKGEGRWGANRGLGRPRERGKGRLLGDGQSDG